MNDGGNGGFDANRHKSYVENTSKMLTMAKEDGVRAVLISPNAVDSRKNKDRLVYLGERQNENYQCDANPLRPFRPTLPGGE